MKVAHLTTVHGPFDIRIYQKECRSLAAAGHEVVLVAPHDRDERVGGVMIRALPRPENRVERVFLTGLRLMRVVIGERPRVCHLHDPELVPIGLLLKAMGYTVVYDIHENSAEKLRERGWLPAPLRPVGPPLFAALERLATRIFDANVCATVDLTRELPERKTVAVHNYPRAELAAEPLSEESYAPDNRTLIYTGGWTAHRGVEQLVEAMRFVRTPGARLVVLGRRDPEVYERARRSGGFEAVEDVGTVPYEEVVDRLSRSAVGLVCNQPRHGYDRALPNKLFEYMAAGLPVVSSDFPHWRKIVRDSKAGLTVDPTDPREIAGAVDRLLADPDLRRRMGKHGRDAVRERYSWTGEERKLLDLYRGLSP